MTFLYFYTKRLKEFDPIGFIIESTSKEFLMNAVDLFVGNVGLTEVLEIVKRVAPKSASVLITGESGTGKELVAQTIHALSLRNRGPFVEVNCAAIPDELIESELFGHEKGSFTGAHRECQGAFSAANKGTIFLDEIGDMSPRTQAKVLRVLQDRKFNRVGSPVSIQVDVRVIAATNKGLPQEILEGRFREDLYYRLNVIPIHLPPLRKRKDDIPSLVANFLGALDSQAVMSPEALDLLRAFKWPGNIRQLRNAIEYATAMSDDHTIEVDKLPHEVQGDVETFSTTVELGESVLTALENVPGTLDKRLETIKRVLIIRALKKTDNNKKRAAYLLGMNRTTLLDTMHRLHINMEVDTG